MKEGRSGSHSRGDGRAVSGCSFRDLDPLLEASIEGARGILLNISGGSD